MFSRGADRPRQRDQVAVPASRGMSLVHIATVPESLGFLRGQAEYLKQRGFSVHVVTSPGPLLDDFGAREPVAAHGLTMQRRITPLQDLAAVSRLALLLRRIRPAVVHSHTPKGGLLGMIAAWLVRAPVRVYHIHGLPYLTATGYRRVLLRLSERVACRLAHEVLCVSPSIRAAAVRDGICPDAKVRVLGRGSINGVDAQGRFDPGRLPAGTAQATRARQGIPKDALVVGFVGRIVRDKGIAELVEAWTLLRERYPSLHVLLVGPMEDQDPVPPEALRVLREDERLHLAGEDWNTPPLFAAMDLVVLPTYREGFPVVPLEAAAMGLAVVATRVPGCVDAVVDGVTGTLVPARDAKALADAIAAYLDDPALRQRHGQAGRERVLRDFRPEVMWEALYGEYSRLLGAKGLALPEPAS